MKQVLALTAAAVFLVGGMMVGANATPLPATFSISGKFDDGATFSGTFGISEYGYLRDVDTNIVTTPGVLAGNTYTTPPDGRSILPNDPATAVAFELIEFSNPFTTFRIQFSGLINDTSGSIFTNLPMLSMMVGIGGPSYECKSWTCPTGGITRYIVEASFTQSGNNQVPLPGAVYMFGTIIAAGVGAHQLRRRRRLAQAAA